MADAPSVYPIACSMELVQALKVQRMIAAHDEFLGIEVTINRDRRTYGPFLDSRIPEGEALVTFCVPREGINMADFFREFSRTLNQELPLGLQRERE